MEAKSLDPVEFRGAQREQWNGAAAGWRKWYGKMSEATQPVSDRMVELAGVEPGHRVLDVAAGYGEPALTAAKVVGSGGSVVASDIAAEMLAFGRERAAEAGLENVEFVESDASALDFPEGSFDAALSRWGIIFEPDAEGAAGRIRSFLKPDARIAIASWATPDRVPMIGLPMMTAMQKLQVPPPPPGTPGPLSRPTAEAVGGLLQAGGFSGIEVEEIEVTIEAESPEEFVTFTREIVAPLRALIEAHPPELQAETWAAIGEAVAQHAGDDGRIRLPSVALLASGSA